MEKQAKKTDTTPFPLKGRGRFVGLVGVGKELYQPIVIETLDGQITSATQLSKPAVRTTNGVEIHGDQLPSAAMQIAIGVQRHIRDRASELWQGVFK